MSTVSLEVAARPAPELLERVARCLRHRGATVQRLAFETGPTETIITAEVTCSRPVSLLARHLERLPDVRTVRTS